MEIILMRHSVTRGNLEHIFNGSIDEPLCAEGIERAKESGARPDITFAAVSPLKRTSETAAICFPNANQKVYAGLSEMNFGAFDGHTRDELSKDERFLAWEREPLTTVCPDGECLTDLLKRAPAAFCDAVSDASKLHQKSIAVVSHGGAISAIMYTLFGERREPLKWFPDNCCGYKITIDTDAWEADRTFISAEYFERL